MRPVPAHVFALALALLSAAPGGVRADHHEASEATSAAGEPSATPDWPAVADVDTVAITTRDEDGGERVTTIWLAVVDGQGYVRTGDTSWYENIERDPRIYLRIGETVYALLASPVAENDPTFERVQNAFSEKYGFSDTLVGWMPGMGTRVLRLLPRDD